MEKRGNNNSRGKYILSCKLNKKSQQVLGMSFGVIFSILLIIFFIVIAIIVINSFLSSKNCVQVGLFVDNLDEDIKRAWNSQHDLHTFEGNLPSGIEYVCFANLSGNYNGDSDKVLEEIWRQVTLFEGEEYNMFFYPAKKTCDMANHKISHLDVGKITDKKNPFCIQTKSGKISFEVEKKSNSRLVEIRKI
jgi:hypothetical protein